jgi:hypothetical protein
MPIVMGPPAFVTLSNIRTIPSSTGWTITFDTDQPVLMAMDYWSQNDPSLQNPWAGSVLEGVLTTHHSIATAALPAGKHVGYVFGYSLRLDANDVSGLTLRPQQGLVQLLGARAPGQTAFGNALSVPVRFYQFGGTPPPGPGGTQPGGGGPNIGNWSTYTWAQYNPKGTTYPTP